MNDLIVEKIAQWQRLKALVLDSVSSPITKRVYSMALDEFLAWFRQEPRARLIVDYHPHVGDPQAGWRSSRQRDNCARVGCRHCPREECQIDRDSGWELADGSGRRRLFSARRTSLR